MPKSLGSAALYRYWWCLLEKIYERERKGFFVHEDAMLVCLYDMCDRARTELRARNIAPFSDADVCPACNGDGCRDCSWVGTMEWYLDVAWWRRHDCAHGQRRAPLPYDLEDIARVNLDELADRAPLLREVDA